MSTFADFMDDDGAGPQLVNDLEQKLSLAVVSGTPVLLDPAEAMWVIVNLINHTAVAHVLLSTGFNVAVEPLSAPMSRERLTALVPDWLQMRRPQ